MHAMEWRVLERGGPVADDEEPLLRQPNECLGLFHPASSCTLGSLRLGFGLLLRGLSRRSLKAGDLQVAPKLKYLLKVLLLA